MICLLFCFLFIEVRLIIFRGLKKMQIFWSGNKDPLIASNIYIAINTQKKHHAA